MEKRDDLVKAAATALEEHGIEGLTVRDVAHRAGQSTIGIYRHFTGKAGLLDMLFRLGFERLGEAARRAGAGDLSLREAVLAAVRAYLDLAREQPQHYRLMFSPASANYAPTGDARAKALEDYENFVALVARLPGHSEDARRVAADLFALVHGHVALRTQRFGPEIDTAEWEGRIVSSVERQLDMLARD